MGGPEAAGAEADLPRSALRDPGANRLRGRARAPDRRPERRSARQVYPRHGARGQVFAGKVLAVLTYTFVAVFAMGLVGLAAGSIAWGFHPLTSLSGTKVSAGHGF